MSADSRVKILTAAICGNLTSAVYYHWYFCKKKLYSESKTNLNSKWKTTRKNIR